MMIGGFMKLFDNVRSFILENEFSIHIYDNRVHIANYDSIGHFDSREVWVYHSDKTIIIKGENLALSKLMQEEILISGMIKMIEFR